MTLSIHEENFPKVQDGDYTKHKVVNYTKYTRHRFIIKRRNSPDGGRFNDPVCNNLSCTVVRDAHSL